FFDFDNDGHLDLLVAPLSGNLLSYLGHGNGTFTIRTTVFPYPGTSGASKSVDLADLDGDGNLDIIVNTRYLYIHMGHGDGVNFTYGGSIADVSSWGEMEILDMDDDGDLDLILVRYAQRDVRTYENTGLWRQVPMFNLVDTHAVSSSIYVFGLTRSQPTFKTSGSVTSPVHDMGSAVDWRYVQLDHISTKGQTLDLEVRTSSDNSSWTAWARVFPGGSPGEGPLTTAAFPGGPSARYVQWRVTMEDAGGINTPFVRSVNLLGVSTDPTVKLRWRRSGSSDLAPWSTATMTKQSAGSYSGTVPAPPLGPVSHMDIVVFARKSGGVEGESMTQAYRDTSGPILMWANALPYYSNTTTAVRVVADLEDASGVANATLYYSFNNSTWTNVSMSLGHDGFTDLDGDDDTELAVAVETSASVYILDGDLTTNWSMTGLGNNIHKPMVAGDIDGDGTPELVIGDPSSNAATFWVLKHNATSGEYEITYTHIATADNPVYSLELADVDGDGRVEILRGQQNDLCVVSSWDGSYFRDTHSFFLAYDPYVIRALDWDGDGRVEIISTDRSTESRVRVYSWTGSDFAVEYISPDLGEPIYGFTMADMDADGSLDMILSVENFYTTYSSVLYMLTCTGPDRYDVLWKGGHGGRYTYLYDAADWDDDGRMEVAVGHYDHGQAPAGTFAVTYEWDPDTSSLVEDWISMGLPDVYSGRARFMDLDGDGSLELIVPSRNGYVYAFTPDGREWAFSSSDLGTSAGTFYGGALTPLGSPDTWSALIPAPGTETKVWYYMVTTDLSGQSTTTRTQIYYSDGTAPTINNVSSPPTYLRVQDPLEVFCNVTDSVSIGGAMLEYNVTGGSWASIEMTRLTTGETTQFMAIIPAIWSATTVTYRVVARDIAYNTRTSATRSYVVDPGPTFNWMKDGFGSPFKWEIHVTDNGAVASVAITYSTDTVTWYNATVSNLGDIFTATIDVDANSTVYFLVTATDDLGLTNSFRGRSGDSNITMLVADPLALTTEEQQVYQVFHDLYYTILLLDDDQASVANLSSSDLVIVVDNGRISSSLVTDLIDDGVSVLLLHDGMRNVANSGWYLSTSGNYKYLRIVSEEDPFKFYYRTVIQIQSGSNAGRVTSVPSGWTLVAFNKETNRYTLIKKENTTSGGKAITFPYDIRYLTVRGYYFLDQLLNWTLGEKVDGPINATSGNVVLVINSDDWTLSTREDKLKTLLETWGYDIQRIRIKDVPRFNATNATAVVVPAYYTSYGDQGYFWDKFMDQGVPVILLRNALQTYRTSNRVLGHTDYQYSIVISDSWFVTGYNGTRF
ncbi:MAG: VCBS repeat-containing protein, partial [Thermoplasmata archaeon]|nr:VCBS repeat-containing protein [Thermoplasmata archaeon]